MCVSVLCSLAEKLLKNHSDRCNKLVRYFFCAEIIKIREPEIIEDRFPQNNVPGDKDSGSKLCFQPIQEISLAPVNFNLCTED